MVPHITTGEVTALQHKLRDDTVEFGSSVTKALFTCAKSTEILSGPGNNVVVKGEVDTTILI